MGKKSRRRADQIIESKHVSEVTELSKEVKKREQVYNCLGNLNWFLDGFLLWASEIADNEGDYFPGDEIAKASPEEIREYVRKVRCNIRVVQAIIDASIYYENLDNPLDEHELIAFYNESLKLYRSTDDLIHGFGSGQTGLQNPGHSYLDYLCGPGLNAMAEFGVEFYADFQEKIIARKKANAGMHFTQPTTTCSMWAWKTTPERSWSLSNVSRQTKRAVNTCLKSGGRPGFLVHAADMTPHGICRGTCTFVPAAGFRSL